MYSMKDLASEIREVIDGLIESGALIHPDWVTRSIMAKHQEIEGDDSDFYTCCTEDRVRSHVTKSIGSFKAKVEYDPQLILPGFNRLQKVYVCKDADKFVGIPVDQMSFDQLMEKAIEYSAMGDGCHQHSEELRRYAEEKFGDNPASL